MRTRTIIVGASSGIGEALARELAARGHTIAVTARRADRLEPLARELGGVWRAHDVTDYADVPAAFAELVAALGGLDTVVYAAGVMPRIDADTFDFSVDHEVVATNLLGAMAWLDLAAVAFRDQGAGRIVGIGSVAGDRGRTPQPAYGASKAALHSFLESLRNRLHRHGVHVLTVKPGPVRTAMVEGRGELPLLIDANVAARQIADAMHRGAQEIYVPKAWGAIMPVVRAIPSVVFRRLDV